MLETKGYAAFDPKSPLRPFSFQRREPGDKDVLIEILYCGVCHSDLHTARNEWQGTSYPVVPGHEIVGRVARVGGKVTKVAQGDLAGVGCFVDSCRTCDNCGKDLEQYCDNGVQTYNSPEKDGKSRTYGGYSGQIVVDEHFVLKVKEGQPLEGVAPLLCAGITTYSPLRHWNVGKGSRVAVLGLGGLGHMGVKIAAALGAEVTMLSGSASKKKDAERLGAHEFVLTSDDRALATAASRFDLILDTVSAPHALPMYLNLLRTDGTLVLLGAPDKPLEVPAFSLIPRRRAIAGSMIGGIKETQEMLDFCAEHGITSDVEVIPMKAINEAYERMLKSDVRYRFSIDMKTLEA